MSIRSDGSRCAWTKRDPPSSAKPNLQLSTQNNRIKIVIIGAFSLSYRSTQAARSIYPVLPELLTAGVIVLSAGF